MKRSAICVAALLLCGCERTGLREIPLEASTESIVLVSERAATIEAWAERRAFQVEDLVTPEGTALWALLHDRSLESLRLPEGALVQAIPGQRDRALPGTPAAIYQLRIDDDVWIR